MTATPYKRCSCCGRTFTPAQWAALPKLAPWPLEDDEGPYTLIMANCDCGSTIGIEVRP